MAGARRTPTTSPLNTTVGAGSPPWGGGRPGGRRGPGGPPPSRESIRSRLAIEWTEGFLCRRPAARGSEGPIVRRAPLGEGDDVLGVQGGGGRAGGEGGGGGVGPFKGMTEDKCGNSLG